jgi:hypothetical protein
VPLARQPPLNPSAARPQKRRGHVKGRIDDHQG